MKITVFGIGYVELVQAAVLADSGHDVVCVDVDALKVAALQAGKVPLFEPGLDEMVGKNLAANRLQFTTDAVAGIAHASILFIAVGTPQDDDGSADLKYVLAVADTIADNVADGCTVVVKSTVPVGTCDTIAERIRARLETRKRTDITVDVASNPEFLREGSAVADCANPDRIIVGFSSPRTDAVLREIYQPFNTDGNRIISMDLRSSELTKYAANCMLAARISLMNEFANLAGLLEADIESVRKGIAIDPRIGPHFLSPGIGYGGSCFPKDVRALLNTARRNDYQMRIIESVEWRNEEQKKLFARKILDYFPDGVKGRTFALWGLSFKPETNDMREAPARSIMEALWDAGAEIRAYDPKAADECRRIYGERKDLSLVETPEAALPGADGLIVATEWKEFRQPDFRFLRATLRTPVIFDGRNIFDPETVARHGLDYFGVGRAVVAERRVFRNAAAS